jgi:hypothetical protein
MYTQAGKLWQVPESTEKRIQGMKNDYISPVNWKNGAERGRWAKLLHGSRPAQAIAPDLAATR